MSKISNEQAIEELQFALDTYAGIEIDPRALLKGISAIKGRRARWVDVNGEYCCSGCRHPTYDSQLFHYCPNCGAMMINKKE